MGGRLGFELKLCVGKVAIITLYDLIFSFTTCTFNLKCVISCDTCGITKKVPNPPTSAIGQTTR